MNYTDIAEYKQVAKCTVLFSLASTKTAGMDLSIYLFETTNKRSSIALFSGHTNLARWLQVEKSPGDAQQFRPKKIAAVQGQFSAILSPVTEKLEPNEPPKSEWSRYWLESTPPDPTGAVSSKHTQSMWVSLDKHSMLCLYPHFMQQSKHAYSHYK